MQMTLDGGALVLGIITVLLAIIQIFVGLWIKGQQERMNANSQLSAKLQKELSDFRELVARDYVTRDETQTQRQEFGETLRSIDTRLQRLNDKMDSKADK